MYIQLVLTLDFRAVISMISNLITKRNSQKNFQNPHSIKKEKEAVLNVAEHIIILRPICWL